MSNHHATWMCLGLSLALLGCSSSTSRTAPAAASDPGQASSSPAVPAVAPPVRDARQDAAAIESVLWQDQMAAQQGQIFQRSGRGAAAAASWTAGRMRAIDTS